MSRRARVIYDKDARRAEDKRRHIITPTFAPRHVIYVERVQRTRADDAHEPRADGLFFARQRKDTTRAQRAARRSR